MDNLYNKVDDLSIRGYSYFEKPPCSEAGASYLPRKFDNFLFFKFFMGFGQEKGP